MRESSWRVNSYGYPSPFSGRQEAWLTFLSFFESDSYAQLKGNWAAGEFDAGRNLNSHAVESWKAAFEQFGLLYVLTGSDKVVITPGGSSLRAAATSGDEKAFAWIGLNLLLRYPLRGPRSKRYGEQKDSDLLPYWFFHAALADLDNRLYVSEFISILARIFNVSECTAAVDTIQTARSSRTVAVAVPKKGGEYNSLNQVYVQAGLNHLLLTKRSSAGGALPLDEEISVKPDFVPLVQCALGGAAEGTCLTGSFTARMPHAPSFESEEEYFVNLGAQVPPMEPRVSVAQFREGDEIVSILKQGSHYQAESISAILGVPSALCFIEPGMRLILGHDPKKSYKALSKDMLPGGRIRITVRPARPITDITSINHLLREQ